MSKFIENWKLDDKLLIVIRYQFRFRLLQHMFVYNMTKLHLYWTYVFTALRLWVVFFVFWNFETAKTAKCRKIFSNSLPKFLTRFWKLCLLWKISVLALGVLFLEMVSVFYLEDFFDYVTHEKFRVHKRANDGDDGHDAGTETSKLWHNIENILGISNMNTSMVCQEKVSPHQKFICLILKSFVISGDVFNFDFSTTSPNWPNSKAHITTLFRVSIRPPPTISCIDFIEFYVIVVVHVFSGLKLKLRMKFINSYHWWCSRR